MPRRQLSILTAMIVGLAALAAPLTASARAPRAARTQALVCHRPLVRIRRGHRSVRVCPTARTARVAAAARAHARPFAPARNTRPVLKPSPAVSAPAGSAASAPATTSVTLPPSTTTSATATPAPSSRRCRVGWWWV